MKKKSELSQPAKLLKKKPNHWKDYDFENLPELSADQIADFRKVTKETHQKFQVTSVRKVGRPAKPVTEKEKQISIRFKPAMLKKIKEKARRNGYSSYQRFIKAVLEKSVI